MTDDTLNAALAQYDFTLPQDLIAQEPARPRDNAKLLIYNRKTGGVFFDTFRNIGRYLPPHSVLVFNDTKVIPARMAGTKQTGGTVEIFYINHDAKTVSALVSPRVAPGQRIFLTRTLFFTVAAIEKKLSVLVPNFPVSQIHALCARFGKTPIPPYIKHSPLSERQLRAQYQTVFAHAAGSVAAPTASLHFTKPLLDRLKKQGHEIVFATLHVNLGTFAPLEETNVRTKTLHAEWYEVSKRTADIIQRAKNNRRPVIACGTTVARTLESAMRNKRLQTGWRKTDLFIRPEYRFACIDGLITNFHLPKSSLVMLVGAFVGRKKLLALYQEAIGRNFRFYSFGDGMLIM